MTPVAGPVSFAPGVPGSLVGAAPSIAPPRRSDARRSLVTPLVTLPRRGAAPRSRQPPRPRDPPRGWPASDPAASGASTSGASTSGASRGRLMAAVVAVTIFVAAYALIASERFDRVAVALAGAGLMLAFRLLSGPEA